MSEVRLSVERKVGRHRLKAAKPPYTVPTMKEVAALPWNGLRVASTFSGGGGSCTGYRMAGYRVVYANEFIPAAQETYKANHPDSFLDTRDIRTVSAADVLKATGLSEGELDLFDGSPPCSAFSTAGKLEGPSGYLATVLHRLTIAGKVSSGVPPADIIAKELSLSGVQRPLPPGFIEAASANAVEVFRFGEFAGWVIEAPE